MECEQPKDGNVVPGKYLDQQGTKSEATAASITKGKRNRKSDAEKSLDIVFENFKQASSEKFLRWWAINILMSTVPTFSQWRQVVIFRGGGGRWKGKIHLDDKIPKGPR